MENEKLKEIIEQLKYGSNGLIPAIIQDVENGEVLMFAFMNQASLEQTLATGFATYWSRSRQKFWVKGESSGHTQKVKNIYYDCDKDCLLVKIEQNIAACHKGYRSCFFTEITENGPKIIDEKVFDEKEVY
ncbi:MAG: phosphoribosyl-AMP cyclohydrolase [Deltaproteobacteria bacterium]|nr:phosphoribosyl-AMP cyclohydrolase [Deltaproteobacteria bacterium]